MAALVATLVALAAAAASNETPAPVSVPAPVVTAPAVDAPLPAPTPPPGYARPNPFAPPVRSEESKVSSPALETAPLTATLPGAELPPAPPAVPKLNGILFSPEMPVAIVNDTIVRIGDLVDGYRITAITPEAVTLKKESTNYRMTPLALSAVAQAPPLPEPPTAAVAAPAATTETPNPKPAGTPPAAVAKSETPHAASPPAGPASPGWSPATDKPAPAKEVKQ